MHFKTFINFVGILVCVITIMSGCMSPSGKEKNEISSIPEPDTQPHFQEVYRQELPESVLALEWLNDTRFYWTTEVRSVDSISYELHIADVSKGTESLVFERSLAAGHNLDMAVSLIDDQLHLYLRDNSDISTYSKVLFDATDWTVINEKSLDFTQEISWSQKSKQDTMLGQNIITNKKGTFNWEIILYPLESPKHFYPLKQFSKTRYEFSSSIWSPSGEYFMLANRDAFGMNRFESMADLLAYPKSEWPTALQYDVFKKDGDFVFSFTVDFIFKEDGSTSEFDLFWIPDDQIYISSTFYDVASDINQSKDQVLNSSGAVIYENSYKGNRNYFNKVNFMNDGVYYEEKKDDAIHMMQLSFLTGEVADCGPIATGDDWGRVSMSISPNRNFLLLRDHQIIRILEFRK